MTEYNLEKEIYKNYKNGLPFLKNYVNRMEDRIRKGWAYFIEIEHNLQNSKKDLKIVPEKYKNEMLEKIDRLAKEKSGLVDYINGLKKEREQYVKFFNNTPPIPVPLIMDII
jgi:chromosome segregation ATPase